MTSSFIGELHNRLLAQLQRQHPRVTADKITEREFEAMLQTCANACIADGVADDATLKRVVNAILKLLRSSGLIARSGNTKVVDFGDRTGPTALLALTRAAETAGVLSPGLRSSIEEIVKAAPRQAIGDTFDFARSTIRSRHGASERVVGEFFLETFEASSTYWAARPRWIGILADAVGGAVGGAAGAAVGGVVGAAIGAGVLGAAVSSVFA
jgi:hypothetical protein